MLYFIVLGVVSVIWFLLRVIPKPSRITYPCQRMAAANAVAFITWLFGTAIVAAFFKTAFRKLKQSRIPLALVLIILALGVGITTIMLNSNQEILAAAKWQHNDVFVPPDAPNSPMGVAQGTFPGRVTWAHDPAAVSYTPSAPDGNWWENQNTNPERVKKMFDLSLLALTGASNKLEAWDILFRYANIRKGLGDVGYTPGEKISIKPNLVMGLSGNKERINFPGPTPQLLCAIVDDLIDSVGVAGEDITIYDVSTRIPSYIMTPVQSSREKQKIRFVGNPKWLTGDEANRYEAAQCDLESQVHFADTTVAAMFWPKAVTEADYLIHLPNLKPHHMAGVTLTAKNLYGSVFFPTATTEFWPDDEGNYMHGFGPNNKTDSLGNLDTHSGLHRCAAVHDYTDGNVGFFPAREYGTYNYLVDILGHPQIRDKSILYIMDAIYGCDRAGRIAKFESFGNEYTASLFMSQDVIALESVSTDFLRSDAGAAELVYGNVDNYLHESALADNPPSGLEYNPGAEQTSLGSLGVHEHWNNSTDRQYSRNLGIGEGIELFRVDLAIGVGLQDRNALELTADLKPCYPNPFEAVTTLPYTLEQEMEVKIDIVDQQGRIVETLVKENHPAGSFTIQWDASRFPDGIYLCRMTSNSGLVKTIKLQKTQ